MKGVNFLNSKQKNRIIDSLRVVYGFEKKLDFAMWISSKDKIYIINPEVGGVPFEDLRVDSMGIYFGEFKGGTLRLSVEGSQIIGPFAGRNVVELSEQEMRDYFQGQDISKKTGIEGFVILKHKNDFLGCGKAKDDKILNYLPKTRRIVNLH